MAESLEPLTSLNARADLVEAAHSLIAVRFEHEITPREFAAAKHDVVWSIHSGGVGLDPRGTTGRG